MGLRLFVFVGYVLHVQNLCEWKERQILLFNLVYIAFLLYFLFREERDIKFGQKYLFTLILTEVGYGKQTEHTTGGLNDTFQTTGRQSDFLLNHRWVMCNYPLDLLSLHMCPS